MWTVSLPVTIVNASGRDPSLHSADIIGWIMWSVGISAEASADQQKLSFKNSPQNRGKWCNIGLWKYTRHPNYFGEVSATISPNAHGFFTRVMLSPQLKARVILTPVLEDCNNWTCFS